MKQAAKRTSWPNLRTASQSASAGPKGIAIAPPAYGIEIADRGAQAQAIQMKAGHDSAGPTLRNHTGLPDRLKTGIEGLSGLSLDDMRVHYNSPRPAQSSGAAVQRNGGPQVVQRVATFKVASHTPGRSGNLDLTDLGGAQFSPESSRYVSRGRIQIKANTNGEAQDWYAGHVQTLYKGQIKTRYKNPQGKVKAEETAKTQTIRDGDDGLGPWYEVTGAGRVQFPGRNATVDVELEDTPTNPVDWDETDRAGNPVGFAEMEGKDTFGTWIIARNEQTKAKEFLAWETWHVDWGIESDYWSTGVKNVEATTGRTAKTGSGKGRGQRTPEYSNTAANTQLDVTWQKS